MKRWVLATLLASVSGAAHAGDKILFQPVPAWVKPAPAVDPAKIDSATPSTILFDEQQRFEDGMVWDYVDSATRVATPEMLSAVGTIKVPWQPAHGDLVVHRLEIIRGTERIDLLKGANTFTVLRREEQMDRRMLDGVLTATMPVSGLAVGDVLHMTLSTTRKDPTLKGGMQSVSPLPSVPARAGFARLRLLWPIGSDVRWRAYSDGVDAKPVRVGGYNELTVPLPLPKQSDIPADAPLRFQHVPLLEASSFGDWQTVAAIMAPLYRTEGLIPVGSPLKAEVDRIASAETDPLKRAALALQLVQDKVSYLLNGMDTGNYVPQTPAFTWSARYGDCKAKTLLLLAILHELGIDAVPVLANLQIGGLVPDRLPGVAAFNHVFVRVRIAGTDYWLDGTGSGDRYPDIADVPRYGTVLPLEDKAALYTLPLKPSARPITDATIEYDDRAGLRLPTVVHVQMRLRGGAAGYFNAAYSQASADQQNEIVQTILQPFIGEAQYGPTKTTYDPVTGNAMIEATGLVTTPWQLQDRRLRLTADRAVSTIDFTPDRARPAWQKIPVIGVRSNPIGYHLTYLLPNGGQGFTLDGDRTVPAELAGARLTRRVVEAPGRVTLDDTFEGLGTEIAPDRVAAVRAEVTQAQARLLAIVAPADYPSRAAVADAAEQTGALKPIEAVFAQAIARDPKEVSGYQSRASFRAGVFDRKGAIADLSQVITIEPTTDAYLKRAALYLDTGQDTKALADLKSAQALDPASPDILNRLATYEADHGDTAEGLALVDEALANAGTNRSSYLATKADLQARTDPTAALATIDAAVADKPGNPNLLNTRCWLKGTRNVALESALKDCTKAIELAEQPAHILDSRAMVYFRMNRLDDAMADLDAALETAPDQGQSLYLRGLIRKRRGDAAGAVRDIRMATLIEPTIVKTYAAFGVGP